MRPGAEAPRHDAKNRHTLTAGNRILLGGKGDDVGRKGYSPPPPTRFSPRLPSRRPSQDKHHNSLSSPAHCWRSIRPVRNPTPRREGLAYSRPGSLPHTAAARLLTRPPRSHSTLHSPRTGNPLETASSISRLSRSS